ncbi:MAG: AsnC family transcriptional regulator [Dethiobacter sp.]|nr:AsnC family transcriptional regulator [Dethiobacter sp.]MCL5981181.1 AsnC family transcriptional regulator [Bacillota bacterium]
MKQRNVAEPLSTLDRSLLNMLQTGFPRVSRPFAELGRQLGMTEEEVLGRVAALKESGLIRRIGGIFDSQKMGFISTLVALEVETDKIGEVAATVSSYQGVTHNYEREHEFNVWFTLVAASAEELQKTLDEIISLPGVVKLRNLPALRLFKIGVNFDLSGDEE